MRGKRGAEIEEIVKIIVVVVILIVLAAAVLFLFKGKGTSALDSIKNMLHFGR